MKRLWTKTTANIFILLLLSSAAITGFSIFYNFHSQNVTRLIQEEELIRLMAFGSSSIEPFRRQFREGKINKDEAIKLIADQIRLFAYNNNRFSDYMFMFSYDGVMLVHPYEPELEGTDRIDLIDPEGRYIIRDMIAQAKSGAGFTEYMYPKPGSELPLRKLSYIKGLDEINCFIGITVYPSDLRKFTTEVTQKLILVFFLFIATIAVFASIIISPIINSVRYISRKFEQAESGADINELLRDKHRFRKGSDAENLVNRFRDMSRSFYEKNDRLIKALHERNKLRDEHIKMIEESLSEKDIMLREINHRVKNNLQIIISLLRIQVMQTDEQVIKDSFLETISRLESISIIHNMLYSNEEYSSISGKKYLSELADYIFHSFGAGNRITLEYEMDDTELNLDQAVTLGIITNEIMTNSIKYAFPNDTIGKIRITLNSEGENRIYSIVDNGKGLPDKHMTGRETSLGITLIINLCRQLNGELEIDNKNGTSYRLVFS